MSALPQPGAVIRAGRPEDATAIREILLESNLSAPAAGDVERTTQRRIGEIATLVCEQNWQVVGVLQWRSLGSEAEILDVAIGPEYRRKGHASLLLKNFLQTSTANVEKVFLEVRESNAAAIALYKKFGFQISGRRPNYYRNPAESALLMSLSLQV